MNPHLRRQAFAVALAACIGSVQAQSFLVSTGGKDQTYSRMFSELGAQCQDEVDTRFVERESTGSIENLDRLLNNEVTAAIVQIDVLHLRSSVEDLSNIKALFALHPEEVHIVARSAARKEGGFFGTKFGAKTVSLNSLADLRGRVLGSWGGGFVTAQVIRLRSGVDFKVREFTDQAEAKRALDEGRVDAILSVAGAPVAWIQDLNRSYKLLAVGDAEANKLKAVYRPARVSYTNLGQNGVPTIATEATMVTREYKTPALTTMLAKVRGCFQARIPELQEKAGNHAKWQAVKANDEPRWPMYQLPVVAPAQTASK